jgi:hypothetical protein
MMNGIFRTGTDLVHNHIGGVNVWLDGPTSEPKHFSAADIADVIAHPTEGQITLEDGTFHRGLRIEYVEISSGRDKAPVVESPTVEDPAAAARERAYTPADIQAAIDDLKAVESGSERPEWEDRDPRTRAGQLWRMLVQTCSPIHRFTSSTGTSSPVSNRLTATAGAADSVPEGFAPKVQELVRERGSAYGSPSENHQLTAELWSIWLSRRLGVAVTFSAEDVCMFNVLQKQSRLAFITKDDSWFDIAGYTENVAMLRPEQRNI